MTSSSKWQPQRLRGRKGPSLGSIAQLMIQHDAFRGEMTRNGPFGQQRDRYMGRGLCGYRDRCGKKASSRHKGSDAEGARRFKKCWKGGIDNQNIWQTFWGHLQRYQRQSDGSCKLGCWGGWGRRDRWWRRYSAAQADRRWWIRLSDGHTLQNGTATHGECSAETDEAWRIYAKGMVGHSWLHLWQKYVVCDSQIDGSGSGRAANTHDCSHTITYIISRASADCWYSPRTIPVTKWEFSPRKESNKDGFRETSVIPTDSI